MNPDNALIYRRMFPIDQGRVVIEEKWDLTHPECPFVRSPWSPWQGPLQSPQVRQIILTEEQFAASNIPLKAQPS